jgi:hypothetical protein
LHEMPFSLVSTEHWILDGFKFVRPLLISALAFGAVVATCNGYVRGFRLQRRSVPLLDRGHRQLVRLRLTFLPHVGFIDFHPKECLCESVRSVVPLLALLTTGRSCDFCWSSFRWYLSWERLGCVLHNCIPSGYFA